MRRSIVLGILMVVFLTGCQPGTVVPTVSVTATNEVLEKGIMLEPEGFIQRTHDPVIAHENDTYYVFSTGSLIPFICSKDKVVWEFCGRVFKSNSVWTRDINPNLVDIWAPDISYFNDQWHL